MPVAMRKSARHSRVREEFLLENMCFLEFLTWIYHLGRWMPGAMRNFARHSRGRGVLVGEPVFPRSS